MFESDVDCCSPETPVGKASVLADRQRHDTSAKMEVLTSGLDIGDQGWPLLCWPLKLPLSENLVDVLDRDVISDHRRYWTSFTSNFGCTWFDHEQQRDIEFCLPRTEILSVSHIGASPNVIRPTDISCWPDHWIELELKPLIIVQVIELPTTNIFSPGTDTDFSDRNCYLH